MDVKNKVVLVTGGASGLGGATVEHLYKNGAKVVIADLQEKAGATLANRLGDNALFVRTDVTDENSVRAALDATEDKFGDLHILVNCAGISIAQKVLGKNKTMSLDNFSMVIRVNLIGTFNVTRLAAEIMSTNTPNEEGERGVIINTASVAAFEGQIGQVPYSASKAGVAGMTLPLAREFAAYGIRVMCIAPGIFDTPMFAMVLDKVREALAQNVPFPPRLGRPGEYAQLVQDIVENPMLNGTVIRLDGALRMQPR